MQMTLTINRETLGPIQVDRLKELEVVIERGCKTFLEVAAALLEIRDQRLYRASHSTFDTYCRERWGWGRVHAFRLIQAAEVVKMLPRGNKPKTERQARALVGLEPEQVKVIGERVKFATATAGDVRAAVQRVTKKADAVPKATATTADDGARLAKFKARLLQDVRDDVLRAVDNWPARESKLELYINLVMLADEVYPEGAEDAHPRATPETFRKCAAAMAAELAPEPEPVENVIGSAEARP